LSLSAVLEGGQCGTIGSKRLELPSAMQNSIETAACKRFNA